MIYYPSRVFISVAWDLFCPSLIWNRIDISTVIFIAICIHFAIFTKECSLVESVLVRHVSCLRDLVQLCVKQVGWSWGMTVFLATEDQNLRLGDRTGSKPVLDVILEALRPNLDQLPVRRLIARISVKSLNICYRWLISAQHIDVSILNSHSCWEISVSIQLRLLTPLVASNGVYFTRFWRIVEPRTNGVDIIRTDGRKTMAFTRV